VTATDGTNTDVQTITVSVTEVSANHAPSISDATYTITDAVSDGTVIATVSGSDPDAGTTLTYSITAGNTSNVFAINPSTGEITVQDVTTLFGLPSMVFSLTVMIADDGTPPLTDTATIGITISESLRVIEFDDGGSSSGGDTETQTDTGSPSYDGFSSSEGDDTWTSGYDTTPGDSYDAETETLDPAFSDTESTTESTPSETESTESSESSAESESETSEQEANTEETGSETAATNSQSSPQSSRGIGSGMKGPAFKIGGNGAQRSKAALDPKYAIGEVSPEWNQRVDSVVKEFDKENKKTLKIGNFTVNSVCMAMSTVSVGYITWALQGSALLAGMMSSMPLWMSFDPMPILDNYKSKKKDSHDDDNDETEKRIDSLLN